MMLKANGEFLDFNEEVEVEKQIKLFEDISTTDGDFSYSFELPKTLNNIRILGNPYPDNISKQVYQRIPALLLSDGGAETFKGYIRVERLTNVIECSFFAGNNNWFEMLSDSLRSLDWSEYNMEINESTVSNAIFNTEGVVFPFIDNGQLKNRGNALAKLEDLVAGIYVKTVFNKVFSHHGIKIQGELLDDVHFQNSITLCNPKNESLINSKAANIGKTVTQTITLSGVSQLITWNDDSTPPFSNGGNFDLGTESYTADTRMIMKIDIFISGQQVISEPVRFATEVRVNGVVVEEFWTQNPTTELFSAAGTFTLDLNIGDVVDFTIKGGIIEFDDLDILRATVKFTPVFVYYVNGNSVVPDWTQQQYVSNVIKLFNVLASYDAANKTLTLNLFDKIKSKTPIDISEHISGVEIDYSEFISSYAKSNLLGYQQTEDKDIITDFFVYEKGEIVVNNEFLEDQKDVLESEFAQPIGYINNAFAMSMEKTDFIELEDEITVDVTGVTDASGRARFAVEEDEFALSDLVRVEDSTNPSYNGDYMVSSMAAGWIELSEVMYATDARAKISKMNFLYSSSDNVYILRHVPLYTVNKFSGLNSIKVENSAYETLALGFFNLLYTGRQVNTDFKYSLSFSGQSNPLHYQHTLIDQYFGLFTRVLNDPVKLFCTATLPYYLFSQIDFLSPVVIRTEESQNTYYINRITGYKESYLECTIELIKLP
jgi:hypothetical protein